MSNTPRTLDERIQEYLSLGGLFNPELMHPAEAVRDLIIDCQTALSTARRENPILTSTEIVEQIKREKAAVYAKCAEIVRNYCFSNPYRPTVFLDIAEAIERAAAPDVGVK